MRRFVVLALLGVVTVTGVSLAAVERATTPDWSLTLKNIEACSCPMFCQCYFNTQPAMHTEHGAERYCRFNNAFLVSKGHWGTLKLDGAKFWVAGDLGDVDFSQGQMDWAVLTFDPSVTAEQRAAIQTALGHLFPVKWRSFTVGPDAPVTWQYSSDRAEARLDGGKAGEIVLTRVSGMTDDAVTIKNIKFWGAPRNDGFKLMRTNVEAYRRGNKTFEFKGTNGFVVTLNLASKDFKN